MGIEKEATLHKYDDLADVLEVKFRGDHKPGVAGEMAAYLTQSVKEFSPQIMIINLLGFNYSFGNDIGGALVAGLASMRKLGSDRECRILAEDRTAESLRSLFESAGLMPVFGGYFFSDLDSALSSAGRDRPTAA